MSDASQQGTGATKTHSLSQFGHRKSGIKPPVRLIIAPEHHEKMSSARSADRRKRPRSGFGTALVPLSRPHPFGGLAKSSGSRMNQTLSAPSGVVPRNEIRLRSVLVSGIHEKPKPGTQVSQDRCADCKDARRATFASI